MALTSRSQHRLFILVAIACFSVRVFAGSGTENGGGGGEPLAIEFLALAKKMVVAHSDGAIPGLALSSTDFRVLVEGIEKSLEGHDPLIVFPAGETVECFGAPKLGCVDTNHHIRIARDGWIAAPLEKKAEVTAMELLMTSEQKNRYELSPIAARAILSFEANDVSKTRPFFSLRARFFNGALRITQ